MTPYLSPEGGSGAFEFYKKAFGAQELARDATPDGKIVHGGLRIGDSTVMFSDVFPGASTAAPTRLGTSIVTLPICTKDVDRFWERAVAAGAKPTMPLDNQGWGAGTASS